MWRRRGWPQLGGQDDETRGGWEHSSEGTFVSSLRQCKARLQWDDCDLLSDRKIPVTEEESNVPYLICGQCFLEVPHEHAGRMGWTL